MTFQLTEPMLIIGLGGVGAKLAEKAKESLNSDCLLISHDQKDLTPENSIKISTKSVVNPSAHLIRGSTLETLDEIKKNISNYFSGIISADRYYNNEAFKHLKKVQSLKNRHSKFNIEFIRTLVLLEKFEQAFVFSKSVWNEDELFFETDLLLGLNFFIKEDYINAEKYFERLNKISQHNFVFDNFKKII